MTKTKTLQSATMLTLVALLVSAFTSVVPSANAETLVSLEDIAAGNLIRGESYSAVYYYGMDGFRYVFPNDKTYFTWYENFDDVKWISDADLADIQIGGNATYKPGVKMIKINSDPTVYVVGSGGEIRGIPSEEVAEDLYGSTWNQQIDDVPDGFFSNYTMGSDLEMASQFDVDAEEADAFSIDADKGLQTYLTVSILDNDYSPSELELDAGRAVRFVNNGETKHTASADDGSWGTGTLNPGENFTRYFDEEGDYDFHCAYHESMTGTLVVE
ncbi:MAG: cupredoxin domain-containing protein [Candidatus Uhrbacteria bacterium]|nr:cupredoxin domain-containing protein [Candidatus Uhrbacteria bacterium]